MFGLVFAKKYDDESWMTIKPDVSQWNHLRQEMEERAKFNDDDPPQRKDRSDVPAWLRYGVQFGLPAVLGTAVVAWVLHDATGNMKVMIELQRQAVESGRMMQLEHTTIRERLDRAERMQGVIIDILRADCANGATTFQERNGCMTAGSNR